MRKSAGGIKTVLLRKIGGELPTVQGPCEACNKDGRVRYFVAAKLPKPTYLCDNCYKGIRERLEAALASFFLEA